MPPPPSFVPSGTAIAGLRMSPMGGPVMPAVAGNIQEFPPGQAPPGSSQAMIEQMMRQMMAQQRMGRHVDPSAIMQMMNRRNFESQLGQNIGANLVNGFSTALPNLF